MSTIQGQCSPCSGTFECLGKMTWPELVGKTGAVAKAVIEKENPNVKAEYIWCGGVRVLDCCCNRVWLDVDAPEGGDYPNAKVCMVPRVG